MWPKSIHGGYNCDVSIEPLKSETYTKGVTIRRDEYFFNVLKGQVLSPVKVCEESEVATNIQLYEIKQMSFAIKLYLKNDTALTNTFIVIVIISSLSYRLHSELREAEKSLGV